MNEWTPDSLVGKHLIMEFCINSFSTGPMSLLIIEYKNALNDVCFFNCYSVSEKSIIEIPLEKTVINKLLSKRKRFKINGDRENYALFILL